MYTWSKLGFVQSPELAIKEHAALHHREHDITAARRVEQCALNFRGRDCVWPVQSNCAKVRVLTFLDCADAIVDAERARAVDGHEAEQLRAGERAARAQTRTLEQLGAARFFQQVQAV